MSKAKQTRLPFPLSTIKSHSPHNLLHCDIWGPHKTPTHFGKRFFLTIVDDYTRCTWLFLMNHKSETQHLLESFITFAQNQFQASIKTIRVDNGLEFISMYDFLSNSRFSSTHSAYLANITATKEPHTYAQAILDPNWQKTMDEELSALQLNQTWTLTPLPEDRNPSDANGSIK